MAGGERVAKSPPDGYTFEIGNVGTHAYNQTLYKKPLYNAVTDFTPVGLATESPRILMVRKSLPVNNLQEFIAYAKANQKTMQFGSAGVGSATHLPCVLFNLAIGVDVTHVPYRGEGPAMQDLIGGRIDYMCATIQTGAAQANQGDVKPIAILADKRSPIIPTCRPRASRACRHRIERLECVLSAQGRARRRRAQAQQGDERRARRSHDGKRLKDLGLEIVAPERRTPEYLAKLVPEEIARWAKPIQAAGISGD